MEKEHREHKTNVVLQDELWDAGGDYIHLMKSVHLQYMMQIFQDLS